MQKVTSKTLNRKGRLQLGLFGGRTMQVDKDEYSPGDTVLIDINKKKISKVIKFEKGRDIFLIDGKHIGKNGKVEDFDKRKLVFKDSSNQVFETLRQYAVVVSDDILKLLKSISE
jgi:ribosomal protein S4E